MQYHSQCFAITVGYLNATIIRKTRNAAPEFGPNVSSQTRRNQSVDGYRAGFGPPRNSRWRLWTVLEPNRTVYLVRTRTTGGLPGPVANTRAVQSLCEICLLFRQRNHPDLSLKALGNALKRFYQKKGIFREQKMLKSGNAKWMTCWQRNPISHMNQPFIRFVLQGRLLCMGLKRFQQQNVGNFRCA